MKKLVTIQVDASAKGLGTTFIQVDGPVTFTSKVLTSTEQCYANIERELLICIFGAECFQTYMFLVDTSQLRVPQITKTDYDFIIRYCPGEEMVVIDTLSRYSPEDTQGVLLDISVNHIYIDTEKNEIINSQSMMTYF